MGPSEEEGRQVQPRAGRRRTRAAPPLRRDPPGLVPRPTVGTNGLFPGPSRRGALESTEVDHGGEIPGQWPAEGERGRGSTWAGTWTQDPRSPVAYVTDEETGPGGTRRPPRGRVETHPRPSVPKAVSSTRYTWVQIPAFLCTLGPVSQRLSAPGL